MHSGCLWLPSPLLALSPVCVCREGPLLGGVQRLGSGPSEAAPSSFLTDTPPSIYDLAERLLEPSRAIDLLKSVTHFYLEADAHKSRAEPGRALVRDVKTLVTASGGGKDLWRERVKPMIERIVAPPFPSANPRTPKHHTQKPPPAHYSTSQYGQYAYASPAGGVSHASPQPQVQPAAVYSALPQPQPPSYAHPSAISPALAAQRATSPPRTATELLGQGHVFPPGHYAKPCVYCRNERHPGDTCWQQFPMLKGGYKKE